MNGVAALHSELVATHAGPGLSRAVARAVQQQDQRRHPAPLAAAREPRAGGARHRAHRRRLGHRPRAGCGSWSRAPTTPAFRDEFLAIKRDEQGSGWRSCSSDRDGRARRPGVAVRHPGQAHPRVQAAAAERRCTSSRPVSGASAMADGACRAPRTYVFAGKAAPGYGRAKLIIKLIHSVAERRQRRPAHVGRWLKVAFLPGLSRHARRDDLSPRPISASRSRPRARRRPAPAT